ncbi:MAG TPA: hypothetical protein VM915_07200, partial [Verrucomicrobiae bacterium]|nr:hypothetical protein [Verrucomicrobiae bacterium]
MKRILLGTAVGLAGFVAPSLALAQQTDNDDIVVTAQRRAQSAQDVPIALSVIDGDELAEKAVNSINDIE